MIRKTLLIIALAGSVLALPSGCTPGGKNGIAQGPRISTKTHLASARMLEASGNYAGATRQYEYVIENEPNMALAYHRLAVLYVKLGYLDKAQDTLQMAIEKGADEASLRNNLGFTLMRMNRLDDAEQMLDAALAISPDFHRARMNLAICHAKAGRTEDALANFMQVVPQDQAFYNLGVIRMQERDYISGAWAFNEALALNPSLPGVREKATQAVALARHAPHHPADEELLATLANPQTGGSPSTTTPNDYPEVRTAQAPPRSATPNYETMQPASPKIVNSRPPRTQPSDNFEQDESTVPTSTAFASQQPTTTVPNNSARMESVATEPTPVQNATPQRKIVNSRPPRTATAMMPTNASSAPLPEPQVALPLKTVAPMTEVDDATDSWEEDAWTDSGDSDEWSDDWDESDVDAFNQSDEDCPPANTTMTPMRPVQDPTYSRVPTSEPEVQDVAYDSAYEADQKMAETTFQKWITPSNTNTSSPTPTPMFEVSTNPRSTPSSSKSTSQGQPTKTTTNASQSMAPTSSKQPSSVTTPTTSKKTESITATFQWNEPKQNSTAKQTSSTDAKPTSKSPSTGSMTPMRMVPASGNQDPPQKAPALRKRADKAVIKPIDDDAEPMQPANDDGSQNKQSPKSPNENSSGTMQEMTPLA